MYIGGEIELQNGLTGSFVPRKKLSLCHNRDEYRGQGLAMKNRNVCRSEKSDGEILILIPAIDRTVISSSSLTNWIL